MVEDFYQLQKFIIKTAEGEFDINPAFKINPEKNFLTYKSRINYLLQQLTQNENTEINLAANYNLTAIYPGYDSYGVLTEIIITPAEFELNTATTHEETKTFNISSPLLLKSFYMTTGSNSIMNFNNVIGTARAYPTVKKINYLGYTDNKYNYSLEITIKVEEGFQYQTGGRPQKKPTLYLKIFALNVPQEGIKEIPIILVGE